MPKSGRKARLTRLLAPLSPSHLEIADFSEAHKDHQRFAADETHLAITIVAACFEGKSPIERQRMVYRCLKQEWQDGLHALNIKALSAVEFNRGRGAS